MVCNTRFLNWTSSSWFSKIGLTSEIKHYSSVSEHTMPGCGSSVVGKLFMADCLLHVFGCVHWQIWTSRLLSSSWAWHAGVSSTMNFWLLLLPLLTQNMYISSQTSLQASIVSSFSPGYSDPKKSLATLVKAESETHWKSSKLTEYEPREYVHLPQGYRIR